MLGKAASLSMLIYVYIYINISSEIGHDRSPDSLPSELHVTIPMMLLGRLEEDGSACLYTSAATEKTRRRRDDAQ